MLWKRNETKPIGLILHLKKFDIYHTIFSNKDDHINIKKYFQKTTKYKIIFFHHITKWVNNAHLYYLYTLDFWEKILLFKISRVLPQRMGHLHIFPNISELNTNFFKSQNVLTNFIQYMLLQWDENHLQVPLRLRNPLRKVCSTF